MNVFNIKKVLKSSVGYCSYEAALLEVCKESGLKRKEIVDKIKEQDFTLTEIIDNNYVYNSTEFVIVVSTNGILWFIKQKVELSN